MLQPTDHIDVCCAPFGRMLHRAGEKGFSAIAVCDGPERMFEMQARPWDREVSQHFNAIDPQTGYVRWPDLRDAKRQVVPWVTILHHPLRFCPFCGGDLSSVIASLGERFTSLAKHHEQFQNQ
jgi:hypothetical protein